MRETELLFPLILMQVALYATLWGVWSFFTEKANEGMYYKGSLNFIDIWH